MFVILVSGRPRLPTRLVRVPRRIATVECREIVFRVVEGVEEFVSRSRFEFVRDFRFDQRIHERSFRTFRNDDEMIFEFRTDVRFPEAKSDEQRNQ